MKLNFQVLCLVSFLLLVFCVNNAILVLPSSPTLPILYQGSSYAGYNYVGDGIPAINSTFTNSKLALSNGDMFLLGGYTIRKISKQTGIIDTFIIFDPYVACMVGFRSDSDWFYVVASGGIILRIHKDTAAQEFVYQDASIEEAITCSMNSKGDIAIVGSDSESEFFRIFIYNKDLNATSQVFGNPDPFAGQCANESLANSCQMRINTIAYSDDGIVYFTTTDPNVWKLSDSKVFTLDIITETFEVPTFLSIERDSLIMIVTGKYIQKYNMTTGENSRICGQTNFGNSADGTLAVDAYLNNPYYVLFDYSDGTIYISENTKLRRIDPTNQRIYTVLGSVGQYFINTDGLLPNQLYFPNNEHAFLSSNEDIYMVGYDTQNLVKIRAQDERSVVYPLGEKYPYGKIAIAADPTGNSIYYSKNGGFVYKIDANTQSNTVFHTNDSTLLKNTKNPIFGGDYVGLSVNQDDIYISDCRHHVVRKMTKDGNVIVVAGNGKSGFLGDGGLATEASLKCPSHAIIDSAGDLWISDMGNNRIRKVSSTTGLISTIAGNGDTSYGNSNFTISAAYLAESISKDSIYASDYYPGQIKKIVKATGQMMPIAAGSNPQISGFDPTPALSSNFQARALVVLSQNSKEVIYFVDNYNGFVRKLQDDMISIVAGFAVNGPQEPFGNEGPALQVALNYPVGLAYDEVTGNLYVSSSENNQVRKITPQGQSIAVAGNGTRGLFGDGLKAINSTIYPLDLVIKGRELLILDMDANSHIGRVRKMSLDIDSPTLNTLVGGFGDGLLAENAYFQDVLHFQFDEKSNLYTLDFGGNRIRKIDKSTGIINTIAGGGVRIESGIPATQTYFYAFTFTVVSEDVLLIPDKWNHRIIRVSNGIATTLVGSDTAGEPNFSVTANLSTISSPSAVVQTSDGEIIFTHNYDTNRLLKTNKYTQKLEELNIESYPSISEYTYLMRKTSTAELFLVENSQGLIYKLAPSCPSGTFNSLKTQCVNQCFGISDETLGCSAHGYCVSTDTCKCFTGYSGTKCQNFTCNSIYQSDSSVCSGHGVCSSYNNCTCSNGYYGSNCESFDCFGSSSTSQSVCSGNGQCINPNNCTCSTGYYGSACQSTNCFGIASSDMLVCSGNGQCLNPNNCTCKSGYYGTQCESFNCNGIRMDNNTVCSSHGKCSSYNNCTCSNGYYGYNCESFDCFGKTSSDNTVCSSNGQCMNPNNCTCKIGYFGNQCESFNCKGIKNSDSNVCSSKGQCIAPETCKCSNNYFGVNCEMLVQESKRNGTLAIPSTRLNEGTTHYIPNSFMMMFIGMIIFLMNL